MMNYRDLFIEPLDVLSPRGNQSFGAAGEHAAAQLLPWPSVVSGALRSAALADEGLSSGRAIGKLVKDDTELAQRLALPGATAHADAFKLGYFGLAQHDADKTSPLMPLPHDIVVKGDPDDRQVDRVTPMALPSGILTSAKYTQVPILKSADSSKPVTGLWLTNDGWNAYCAGTTPDRSQLISTADIANRRLTVGIGMDAMLRRVEKGQLYTAERIEYRSGIGYWARIHNPHDSHSDKTLLRLGGDGHAARLKNANVHWPEMPISTIVKNARFAIVLCSPALFENGNTPDSINADGLWQGKDFSAQLVARTASRTETISGWDLQKNRPKTARRFVPTGAVYWFDNFTGNPDALAAQLSNGCWHDPLADRESRLIEGYNQIQLLAWHGDK